MDGPKDYPPTPSPEQESELLQVASDYSLSHGLVLRPLSLSTTTAIHAPYSLYPSPFPRHLFERAISLQEDYNDLYARITTDDQFLDKVVGGNVIKVDDFQRRLYDIWRQVKREGVKQPISLGIFRSDYLVHAPSSEVEGANAETISSAMTLKQVEFNTISSSFGALSTRVSQMHRFLIESNQYPQPLHPLLQRSNLENLPVNAALEGIARGLVEAHLSYPNHENAQIMMVIQDGERNAFDQRLLQWQVTEKCKIPLLRVPFSQLRTTLSLSRTNSALLYTPTNGSSPNDSSALGAGNPIEISLVYYRTAYSPNDYYTEQEWSTRLLIEQSFAIKCPSVAMQLAGCKKVQQVLSQPGQVERFVPTTSVRDTSSKSPSSGKEEIGKRLRESFVGLWGMEDVINGGDNNSKDKVEGDVVTIEGGGEELAMREPERFVLKPQREGGGNNIYRQDIPPFLNRLREQDRDLEPGEAKGKEGYILMELIEPPTGMNQVLVKAGESEAKRCDVVSELGIYGVVLLKEELEREGGGCQVLKNETVGHLLRTKGRESDEGGIAVGFSVLDSPVLV